MMGRLEWDQEQLFYSFCLEEVVPDEHPGTSGLTFGRQQQRP